MTPILIPDAILTESGAIVVPKYKIGDYVSKETGWAAWRGKICGWYSSSLTPIGYAVENYFEPGSVQIYPEKALKPWEPPA